MQPATIQMLVSNLNISDPNQSTAFSSALANVFNQTYANNDTATLITNINNAAAANGLGPVSLSLTDSQITSLLQTAVATIEQTVDIYSSNMPQSRERVALVTLAYDSFFGPQSPSLNGDLASGNRAEAWFEIRYRSNGGASRGLAIAKRQYYASAIFSLYADDTSGNVDLDTEYKQIFSMYTAHVADIVNYDQQFSSAIAAANRDYVTNIVLPITKVSGNTRIQDLTGDLHDAAAFLITHYANSKSIGQIFVTPETNGVGAVNRAADAVNDLIFGGTGTDTITSGTGDDVIFGGAGNNTISAGAGNDTIIGGLGTNTLSGGSGDDTLYLNGSSYKAVTGNDLASSSTPLTGNNGPTTLFGGDGNDTFYVGHYGNVNNQIVVDGGAGNDTVNFTNSDPVNVLIENGTPSPADEVGKSIILRNIETIIGSSGNDAFHVDLIGKNQRVKIIGGNGSDTVRVNQGDLLIDLGDDALDRTSNGGQDVIDVSGVPYVYGGDSDDIIAGSGTATVFMGNGNDTLLSAGRGSIINAGEGQDTFNVSNDVLIVGAKPTDTITLGAETLHGGISWKGSQSPWSLGLDGTEYAIDTAGELVIKTPAGQEMFVANYQGGPNSPTDTAGIFLGKADFHAYRITDPALPSDWLQDQFQFVNGLYKAFDGVIFYQGVDPLVLDMTGAGINLTDTSSVSPTFDMNGNGFAVHTGWVEPNMGILVRVAGGADGQIDNISAFFGAQGQSGFAALASYDSNGDGIIDQNDAIYAQLGMWVDADGNGIVDPGEVQSLADAGITAVNLASTAQTDQFIAGNQILATGSFVRADGSTSTAADVSLHTDNFNTRYTGNTTVSSAAAALPNIKGFGTLTDLQVAMTNDPALNVPSATTLMDIVEQTLPSLDVISLPGLQQAMKAVTVDQHNFV